MEDNISLNKHTSSSLDETLSTIRQYQRIYQQSPLPIVASEFSASIQRILKDTELFDTAKSLQNFISTKDTYFSELASAANEFEKIFSQCSLFVSQFSSFISEMQKDMEWISELVLSISQTFNSLQNSQICEILQILSGIWENSSLEDTLTEKIELSEEDKMILSDEIPKALLPDNTSELTSFVNKHPLLVKVITFFLIEMILLSFWESVVVEPLMSLAFRETPDSTSNIVYQVTQEQNIYIIDEVPYYYYVQTTDPNTNELIKGYISKKSLNPYLNSSQTSSEEK